MSCATASRRPASADGFLCGGVSRHALKNGIRLVEPALPDRRDCEQGRQIASVARGKARSRRRFDRPAKRDRCLGKTALVQLKQADLPQQLAVARMSRPAARALAQAVELGAQDSQADPAAQSENLVQTRATIRSRPSQPVNSLARRRQSSSIGPLRGARRRASGASSPSPRAQ